MMVTPDKLRDFVNALADLPYFDIDKNKFSDVVPNFGGDNGFAQKFTMRLKLKEPISIKL